MSQHPPDTTASGLSSISEAISAPDLNPAVRSARGGWGVLIIVVAVVVAYVPAIRGGFIWDDDDYVTNNVNLRSLTGLAAIWFDIGATSQYYPMVHTSFWVEHQLWGLDPLGYHLVNVLLHALGAVLLWFVLRRLSLPGAWLAAAVFALHPVHVESVAWITERKNVLSGVFYLAALLVYLRFDDLQGQAASKRRPGRCWPWPWACSPPPCSVKPSPAPCRPPSCC